MLAAWLPDLQVRRALADWMRQIVERLVPSGITERLAEVGDWLVQCDTGADFLARVGAPPAGETSDRA